jgi:uncharacterized protein (TIGR02300 family)
MSKPELGTKRLCAHCGAKFYDLHHSPITCPMCSRVFELTGASSRSNTRAAPGAVLTIEPVLAEIPEAQLISLEDADGKTEGEQGRDEAEELVELNDEVLDDTSLIEENEQEDAGDEIEEENDVEDND